MRTGGGFGGLDLQPARSAKILAGILVASTASFALVAPLRPHLILTETTVGSLLPLALLSNLFVALPGSFFSLGILLAIAAYFFWDQVRMAWYSNRAGFLVASAVGLLGLMLLNFLLNGFGWGLTAGVLLILWLGTVLERQWGSNRTLIFTLIVSLTVNAVGGILLRIWPSGLSAALGSSSMLIHGHGPLLDAFMTVWCLIAGRRRFALLNIQARHLVWVLVAINALDFLLVGRISGMMGLTGIAVAFLLVSGLWRPRFLLDRIRLFMTERRIASRRGRMRIVKDKRKYH